MAWCFVVRKEKGVLIHYEIGGYESRNESTLWCLKQADARYQWPDFNQIVIHTTDYEHPPSQYTYDENEYTYSKKHSLDRLVPDFNFHGWAQVGINDYEEFVKQIDEAGTKSYEVNKVGWIGNTNTHKARGALFAFGKQYPHLCDIMDSGNWWVNPDDIKLNSKQYMSTPELVAKYAIVLDIEGNGYSGRLKHLLWSHRPLLLVDRSHQEYFFKHLHEWEHYIPVKRDLSDLHEKIKWCMDHYPKACAIAEQAYQFSKKHLTREACYQQWNKIIAKHTTVL